MRPKTKVYQISRKDLDALQIPDEVGMALVHVPYRNKDERTKGGIYIVGDEDFTPAVHAERWGYIYKISKELHYDKTDTSAMHWLTTVEAEVGDKVWFDFRVGIYAHTYECEGEWYKMIVYESLYVVKKKNGDIVPLNGYILFSEYEEKGDSDIIVPSVIEKKYGVVEYIGSYNQEYITRYYSDDIVVESGDHVLFEAKTSCFPLEAVLHNEFSDKKFVLQQRKRIVAVVDKAHKNILRLHEGVLGIKVIERDLTEGEIKLVKDNKSYRIGYVEVSCHNDIKKGDLVVLSKQSGTLFNGIEYLTEERVLYYETNN